VTAASRAAEARPGPSPAAVAPLLEIEGLEVAFRSGEGESRVVEGVDLRVAPGRVLGLVGESGCGKSVTARAVMRLLPEPPARVSARALRFAGRDLLGMGERALRGTRGRDMAMIFQEPMTSLNPTWTIGFQIEESLRLHTDLGPAARRARVRELLGRVGIGAAERRAGQYPFELSGGLRQRAMIAMALACGPKLLIADEPTTALDVTVQAQILDLLAGLRDELGMAILLITHDLGVVAELCDEVAVMYAGRIVERAPVEELFARPRHPYTAGLLAATPRLDGGRRGRLPTIPGTVPPPGRRPSGCVFRPRCGRGLDRCAVEAPPLAGDAAAGHAHACWNPAA
jgi:oligopeptide/dipeptide ABC transporter ATP-binding protein